MFRPEKLGWSWGDAYGIDYYELGDYCLFQDRNNDWVLKKNGETVDRVIPKNKAESEIQNLTRQIKIDFILTSKSK